MQMNANFRSISVLLKMFLIVFPLCLTLLAPSAFSQDSKATWEKPPRQTPKGRIEKPVNNSKVTRHFEVSGTVSGGTRHLWLIERIGDQHWPKEPELRPNSGRWRGEVFEGGRPPEGRFELLLVDVSEETTMRFQEWLKTGHRTGSYPGISVAEMGAVSVLDTKTYKLTEK